MRERVIIVPARAGSKGVKFKNKRFVSGRRLIEYTMDVALGVKNYSKIILSTDDTDILNLYKFDSRIITHDRPHSLAQDDTNISMVIANILQQFQIPHCDVALLQPTSPLRNCDDVNTCFDKLDNSDGTMSVVSVVGVEDTHPARMYSQVDDYLVSDMPRLANLRRQDLPKKYLRNGCVYCFRVENYKFKIITEKIIPYKMPSSRSVNIDTELDLKILEILLNDSNR